MTDKISDRELLVRMDCNVQSLVTNFHEFKKEQKESNVRIHGRMDKKVPRWVLLLLVTVFLTGFGAFAKVLGNVQGNIKEIRMIYVTRGEVIERLKGIKK